MTTVSCFLLTNGRDMRVKVVSTFEQNSNRSSTPTHTVYIYTTSGMRIKMERIIQSFLTNWNLDGQASSTIEADDIWMSHKM